MRPPSPSYSYRPGHPIVSSLEVDIQCFITTFFDRMEGNVVFASRARSSISALVCIFRVNPLGHGILLSFDKARPYRQVPQGCRLNRGALHFSPRNLFHTVLFDDTKPNDLP